MWYKLKRILIYPDGVTEKQVYPAFEMEYQKVEYIQSSGTQYINTLVNPTSSTKVQTKIMVTGTSENWWPIYWVFYNFASNTRFCWWYENWWVWFWYGGNNGANNIVQVWMNTDITIEQYTSWWVSHNIANWTDNSYSWASFTAQNYPMFLFARNNTTSDIDRRLYLKMYYFKIYSWDTLTKYFVPCYRKSDNVIGMYDLVNDVFYTNSWTWTFTKWPDVN